MKVETVRAATAESSGAVSAEVDHSQSISQSIVAVSDDGVAGGNSRRDPTNCSSRSTEVVLTGSATDVHINQSIKCGFI